jgi:dUTP pyrophosphatase
MNIVVQIYPDNLKHDFGLPKYETSGSSGMDVRANEDVVIAPKETKLVHTGLYMAKLRIPNAPGTIDSDYRKELCIIVENTGYGLLGFPIGERISQIVLQEVPKIVWEVVGSKEELGNTDRSGGFGSTGTR